MITETSDEHVYACGKDGNGGIFYRNAGSLEPAVNLFESWIYFSFFSSFSSFGENGYFTLEHQTAKSN